MNIEEIRSEIDCVDKEIASLIKKRMELSRAMAEAKKNEKAPVYDAKREEEVIKNVSRGFKDVELIMIQDIYRKLMDTGKCIQRRNIKRKD